MRFEYSVSSVFPLRSLKWLCASSMENAWIRRSRRRNSLMSHFNNEEPATIYWNSRVFSRIRRGRSLHRSEKIFMLWFFPRERTMRVNEAYNEWFQRPWLNWTVHLSVSSSAITRHQKLSIVCTARRRVNNCGPWNVKYERTQLSKSHFFSHLFRNSTSGIFR